MVASNTGRGYCHCLMRSARAIIALLWHVSISGSDWSEANLGNAARYDRDVDVCESFSFGGNFSRVRIVACSAAIKCANDARHIALPWLLSRVDRDEGT